MSGFAMQKLTTQQRISKPQLMSAQAYYQQSPAAYQFLNSDSTALAHSFDNTF